MRVQCPNCGAGGNLPDAKIPPAGSTITCPKCKSSFLVRKPGAQEIRGPDALALSQEGVQLLKERQLDAAIEKFNQALQANPQSAEAYRYLGLAYGQKNLWAEASQVLQKALAYQPDDLLALKNLGVAYLQQKKFAEAETVLEKALQAAPNDEKVKSYLAIAQQGRKPPAAQKPAAPAKPPKAPSAEALPKASSDKPAPQRDPIRDLLDQGVDYLENAQYNSAVDAFNEVIRLAPQRSDGYLGLGMVYEKRQEWAKAVEAYRKAVELNPNDSSAQENLKFAQKGGKQKPRWKFWGTM